jgi:hypothetical protein
VSGHREIKDPFFAEADGDPKGAIREGTGQGHVKHHSLTGTK